MAISAILLNICIDVRVPAVPFSSTTWFCLFGPDHQNQIAVWSNFDNCVRLDTNFPPPFVTNYTSFAAAAFFSYSLFSTPSQRSSTALYQAGSGENQVIWLILAADDPAEMTEASLS
ncbi:hypothetical protein FHETE_10402 [Fusarium heterosporum]|uniref:Uncharacterized protein n=1 Tax=Fusarium heterosporum TaxID=42747 RepID=A0A8H5WGM4_FUSHE|nr:hypothetical protein FHETE_10402 [Fusarium heterosporum]